MSKPELSRRDFLEATLKLTAVLPLLSLETSSYPGVEDLEPDGVASQAVWPMAGPLSEISGDGKNPTTGYVHFQKTVDVRFEPDGGRHLGIDFNKGDYDEDCGYPLRLFTDGVCVFTGDGISRDLGIIAIFCHKLPGNSLIYSRYAHLQESKVEVGINYQVGSEVGLTGKSGWELGNCHLHFDLSNREAFLGHIRFDPWWYPHIVPDSYRNRYFIDPVDTHKFINNHRKLMSKIDKLMNGLNFSK